jgi:hypothetical protein
MCREFSEIFNDFILRLFIILILDRYVCINGFAFVDHGGRW